MAKVLCCGIIVLDHIFRIAAFPPQPMKVFASDQVTVGGGPAANGAVTVARLGGEATIWGRVGDDEIGRQLVAEFDRHGVDASAVRLVPGHRSGVGAIILDAAGERFSAGYMDKTLDPDPAWLPLEQVAGFDAVLCDVRWPAGAEAVLRAARAAGIRSILDADLTDDDAVERLLPLVDHAVFSELALARFAGTDDPEAGLRRAQARAGGAVSVTLGGEGHAWLEDGVYHRRPAYPVSAVDTLAAGDVFHGAFALGIAEGATIEAAADLAAATAALKCIRWGGRHGIPTRAEVMAFRQGHSGGAGG